MKLIGLGHSELFIEIQNKQGKDMRILSDSWLTSHVFGDFMERSHHLNISFDELPKIDGIFLSHAHCDHFDPYTLVEIYKHQTPDILLPETLTYLEDILKKYLPKANVIVLPDREVFQWNGLDFYGIVFRETHANNENDVMTLCVSNNKEIVYMEVDSAPPDTADFWEELYGVFTRKNYETICYMGTRNELEGIFKSLDASSPKQRRELINTYKEKRQEEIHWQYAQYDEGFSEYPDVTTLNGLTKVFNGQGIVFPKELGTEFDEILIPVSIAEITKWEKSIAKDYGRNIPMDFIICGKALEVSGGKVKQIQTPKYLSKITSRNFTYNPKSQAVRTTIDKPLSVEQRDENLIKSAVLRELNTRFVPYQIASLDSTLREMVLRSPNKSYVIEVKFGDEKKYHSVFFTYSIKQMKFKVSKKDETHVNESYWANDLADLFEGRQEMFSTFLHHLRHERPLHFWTCLNMPFVAPELVQKRFELHFERATKGETVENFVGEYFKNFSR